MAEQLIKNLVCSKCGVEGRPGAAFCYACGGEIIEGTGNQEPSPTRDNGISSAWFRSDITAAESQKLPPLDIQEQLVADPVNNDTVEKRKSGKLKSKVKNQSKKTGSLNAEMTAPLAQEIEESQQSQESEEPQKTKVSPLNVGATPVKKSENIVETKSDLAAQNKLKSAASIRQKSKLAEKKRVEVVWAPPEGAPNVWFVAVAIILTIFAAGVLAVMLYIR